MYIYQTWVWGRRLRSSLFQNAKETRTLPLTMNLEGEGNCSVWEQPPLLPRCLMLCARKERQSPHDANNCGHSGGLASCQVCVHYLIGFSPQLCQVEGILHPLFWNEAQNKVTCPVSDLVSCGAGLELQLAWVHSPRLTTPLSRPYGNNASSGCPVRISGSGLDGMRVAPNMILGSTWAIIVYSIGTYHCVVYLRKIPNMSKSWSDKYYCFSGGSTQFLSLKIVNV